MNRYMKRILISVQLVLPICLFSICILLVVAVGKDKVEVPRYQSGIGLSEEVRAYQAVVYEIAEEYDILEYARYLLAIMQVESAGTGMDVMQSLGYSGLAESEKTPELSIRYACRFFKELLNQAKSVGVDMETVIQAYNYGAGYIAYIASNDKEHSFSLASSFAARQCDGERVIYNNPIAVRMNGGWRYAYGNMFYVYLVKQYLAVDPLSDDVASAIISEALKYKGYAYVWGGANPTTSFDCSGLVQWCYGTVGIQVPHNAQAQYDMMQHITLEEAEPGDLVFFTETMSGGNYITHVGIYVGGERMFHAGNPLGYADLTSRYWKEHYVCAGRIHS